MTGMYLEHYGVKGMKWKNHKLQGDKDYKKKMLQLRIVVQYLKMLREKDKNKLETHLQQVNRKVLRMRLKAKLKSRRKQK